jgi:DNA-binding transcriptional LysR family regulator
MPFAPKQLRVFLAIVDHGSLGRVADVLHLTQPTISRIVAEMEQRLGLRLFERYAKGMVPTAAGETLIPYARQVLFDIQEARDALDNVRGLKRGMVRVAALGSLARHVMPGVIQQFLAEAPGIRVTLIEGAGDRVLSALQRREVDLLLTTTLPPDPEITVIGALRYNYHYGPCCSAGHPLAKETDIPVERALEEPWVLGLPGSRARVLFNEMLSDAGARSFPEALIETDSVEAMVNIVACTRALTWVPKLSMREAEAGGRVRALDVPKLILPREFFVYRRARGLLSPATKLLLKILPWRSELDGQVGPMSDLENLDL